jgi:CheY-like chemotaxis protein
MPAGGSIQVTFENLELGASDVAPLEKGKYVKISIADHGIGIAKEHLAKVFDPYFTTKQRGSGLGLATSHSIIKKHNGQITVASELGKGSTFCIYLPASEKKLVKKSVNNVEIPKGDGRVLVMDDDEVIRETTKNILTVLGYTVVVTPDGTNAIDEYGKAMSSGKRFDAVIMDLTVPGGMGGKEAVAKLLEIDPAARVIVSSGYSNDPVMAEFQTYGFKGIVSKPYRMRELGETIHRVIKEIKETS